MKEVLENYGIDLPDAPVHEKSKDAQTEKCITSFMGIPYS